MAGENSAVPVSVPGQAAGKPVGNRVGNLMGNCDAVMCTAAGNAVGKPTGSGPATPASLPALRTAVAAERTELQVTIQLRFIEKQVKAARAALSISRPSCPLPSGPCPRACPPADGGRARGLPGRRARLAEAQFVATRLSQSRVGAQNRGFSLILGAGGIGFA